MANNVIVITGPTCTGKTSLSIDLCKKFDGEVISADSRQLYKYMDIGTGKSPIGSSYSIEKEDEKWTLDGVNIWGYDLVLPDEYFSVFEFAQFALRKTALLKEDKLVFLVGGTGFYIDTVMGKSPVSGISPDFDLRNKLENKTLSELKVLATSLNLEVKNASERENRQRIIRNIEKKLSSKKNQTTLPYLADANYILFGLTAERSYLYDKADLWVSTIWENGLVEEVKQLRKLGYGRSHKLQGLIYGQVSDMLDGKTTEGECIQKMKYAMHAYIRRQETYFRRMEKIEWFDVSTDSYKQNVYNLVESYVG